MKKLLLILLVLTIASCGKKSENTTTQINNNGDSSVAQISETGSNTNLNPGSQEEQNSQIALICSSCVSNEMDGLTDAQCLGQFGILEVECLELGGSL